MASHPHGECPERSSEAGKSKGNNVFQFAQRRWHRRRMWFVYILRCADDSFYIGETSDVATRVAKHNEGTGAGHTAKHRPVRLVYTEGYANRLDCLKRERQLKRWTRAKKQALIAGDKATLKSL